jgi:hypothetical protein
MSFAKQEITSLVDSNAFFNEYEKSERNVDVFLIYKRQEGKLNASPAHFGNK